MATQPRQWFRLPSISRPTPAAAPIPEPPPPQPRPPIVRAPFRPMGPMGPMGQPQPQEYTQAPAAAGVSSVPTSPIRRTSVPSSPVPRSPTPTTPPATASPPKPQVSAPSSSLPTSPTKPPSTSSMPTSPPKPAPATSPPKPVATTFSAPTSPPKPAPTTFSVPTTSPPKPAPTIFFVPTTSPPKPAPTIFSVPTSPPKPAPTTFSVPTSPAKPEPAVTAAAITTTTRLPSPTPVGPRTRLPDMTPPLSIYKPTTAPPPSPLILPPPQITSKVDTEPTIPTETEQKTVLVQTSSEKPKSWFNGTGNHFDETHKPSSYAKNAKVHRKQFSSDSDETGMRVITIAGENKGAVMEVIKSPLKHSFDGNPHTLHNKGSLKTQSDGTGWHSFSSSSDEEKSKKDKNHKAKAAMLSPRMGAFMNSNVQGVNNSIVFDSSCTHHDPGVHLSLSRKPSDNGFHVKDKSNGHHS